MCILNRESSSVNGGNHQLFDVVGYDSLGEPRMKVGESLSLKEAIGRSLGFNAQPSRLIAAVVPSGSTSSDKLGKPVAEASRAASNASSAVDDSDAKEDAEDATQGKRGLDFYAVARKVFVQQMLQRHLTDVLHNLEYVEDCGDIGIVAQSLQVLCDTLGNDTEDECEAFRMGLLSEWRNEELEVALGLVADEVEAESEAAPA